LEPSEIVRPTTSVDVSDIFWQTALAQTDECAAVSWFKVNLYQRFSRFKGAERLSLLFFA
jgi:hypothetical protein